MPYRSIEDPAKLRRLFEATLVLEGDLDLSTLLRHFIEEARSITGARYGALGVLNDDRTGLAEFLTVGIDPEDEAKIGVRPTGRGALGLLIDDPSPLRLADLGSHPESVGFPPNHPPMTSFLGVPIKVRDEVFGNLYLTDKIGWSEFTTDDEALVESLALGAGIAIENARLHRRVQQVAVYDDRGRMARDLHDRVIQCLFAVGISLQSMASEASASGMADRLNAAIGVLDDTVRQVRSTIYELASADVDRGVRAGIVSLLSDLSPVVGFEVSVSFEGAVDTMISEQVAEHLLATIREAVTNVGRHAQASEASVSVSVQEGQCRLEVRDNGRGVREAKARVGGFGLGNMESRAEKLHGYFTIEDSESGGTSLVWEVPASE
jgi:signal transduction histidine kinase